MKLYMLDWTRLEPPTPPVVRVTSACTAGSLNYTVYSQPLSLSLSSPHVRHCPLYPSTASSGRKIYLFPYPNSSLLSLYQYCEWVQTLWHHWHRLVTLYRHWYRGVITLFSIGWILPAAVGRRLLAQAGGHRVRKSAGDPPWLQVLYIIQYCCQCWGSGSGSGSHVFGPPGSGSGSFGSGSGSGSFPFLINVLSGLKQCLQNQILTQNFSQKWNF
jgi:hypothetical protein